jgi:hypothetical protein
MSNLGHDLGKNYNMTLIFTLEKVKDITLIS